MGDYSEVDFGFDTCRAVFSLLQELQRDKLWADPTEPLCEVEGI